MGSDDASVVDPELRVRGVDGLARRRRVGDADDHPRPHPRAERADRREGRGSDPRRLGASAGCLPERGRPDVVQERFRQRDIPTEVAVFVVAGRTSASASASPTAPLNLAIEPTLTQESHRANKFAAEQHPVRGDGPLELLRALGGEGGVLLSAPRQHERAGGRQAAPALRISAIAPAATYSTIISPDDPAASAARKALPPLVSGSLIILIREWVMGAVKRERQSGAVQFRVTTTLGRRRRDGRRRRSRCRRVDSPARR